MVRPSELSLARVEARRESGHSNACLLGRMSDWWRMMFLYRRGSLRALVRWLRRRRRSLSEDLSRWEAMSRMSSLGRSVNLAMIILSSVAIMASDLGWW